MLEMRLMEGEEGVVREFGVLDARVVVRAHATEIEGEVAEGRREEMKIVEEAGVGRDGVDVEDGEGG